MLDTLPHIIQSCSNLPDVKILCCMELLWHEISTIIISKVKYPQALRVGGIDTYHITVFKIINIGSITKYLRNGLMAS